ncbi:hypothetical protein RAS1_32160 [Phycisphaerae bacterium RAS1]|nr:hypothetical protein RAS1_32160 [Phycisphaerae bacterium RAS1]
MHFLLDANMPRSAAGAVRAAGHECTHLRDTPLADASDAEIAEHARAGRLALMTRDFDFADERAYPPEEHAGIAVFWLPETAGADLVVQLVAAFMRENTCIAALPGRLAIVEFGRIRLRPKPAEWS